MENQEAINSKCISNFETSELILKKTDGVNHLTFVINHENIRCHSSSRIMQLKFEIWEDGRFSSFIKVRNGSGHSHRLHKVTLKGLFMASGHKIPGSQKLLGEFQCRPKQNKQKTVNGWWAPFLIDQWHKISEPGTIAKFDIDCTRTH